MQIDKSIERIKEGLFLTIVWVSPAGGSGSLSHCSWPDLYLPH